ncbi:MAG TPA: hypothetical protein VJC37_06695 [Planctomycetota bacterium]|nr:hypothetical protein [Planctomycetota bacterium]
MKKNWFVVIVAITVLVAIVIFYFGVISYDQEIAQQTDQLKEYQEKIERIMDKKNEVPSQKWIELYQARQKELDNEIANGKKYYMDIDKSLEKWFPGLRIEKEMPSVGDFKTMYLDKKDAQIKELKAKKLYGFIEGEIGEEKRAEEGRDLGFGEPAADNLKKLQKQFWIQESLFASMMESNVVKCERLEFPENNSSWPISFSYGSYIPFKVTVCIQNKDVPGFIYNVMKFRGDKDAPSICVQVRNVSLARISDEINNIPEIMDKKQVPEKDKEAYKPESFRLPLSRLSLEGYVLDFDLSLTMPGVKEGSKNNEKPLKEKPGKSKSAKGNSGEDKNKEDKNK